LPASIQEEAVEARADIGIASAVSDDLPVPGDISIDGRGLDASVTESILECAAPQGSVAVVRRRYNVFGAGFGGVVSFIIGGMEPSWGKNRLEGRGGFDRLDSWFGCSRLSIDELVCPSLNSPWIRTPIDSVPIDRVFKGVNPCLNPAPDNPEPGDRRLNA
jgi:hypothetical protein